MFEITFQQKEDAEKFLSFARQESIEESLFSLNKSKGMFLIKVPLQKEKLLKEIFKKFILIEKRNDWLRTIIDKSFFYTDLSEQQQIIDIVNSLLAGNREELLPLLKGVSPEENITAMIDDLFVQKTSFSFDSFIKFRLKSLLTNLEKYVEVAIDEYKLEQEYQVFVQMLRDFIKNRRAKFNKLHLLFGEEAIFYDQYLRKIDRDVIKKVIDRKLLINHPVYVDSVTIAPLLSIAPNKVYLYTDEKENPLIRTIQNIFEERVTIYPYRAFPLKSGRMINSFSKT